MTTKQKEIICLSTAIVCLGLFLTMLIMLKVGYTFKMDALNAYFYSHQTAAATGFFKVFTYLGEWWVILLIGGLIAIFARDKRVGATCLTGAALAIIMNLSVKYLVRRARPENMLISEIGYSFPSAHAMISFAFYGLLIYYVNKKMNNLGWQIVLSIVLGAIIALLGISRIYLNVHYCSDIVAGFLFGFVALYIGLLTGEAIFKPKPAKQVINQQ